MSSNTIAKAALSREHYQLLKTALDRGRTGAATLTELAQALETASSHGLTETASELQKHIYRRVIPTNESGFFTRRNLGLSICMGVLTSIGVGLFLKWTGIQQKLT